MCVCVLCYNQVQYKNVVFLQGDEDDLHLADTGKTLRDLLIRQRQKIAGANIFDQGSGWKAGWI